MKTRSSGDINFTWTLIIAIMLCMLLSACQKSEQTAGPTMPPLDAAPEDYVDTFDSASDNYAGVASSQRQKSSGTLSNRVAYILYEDGELMLTGNPVNTRLSDEPMLTSYIDKVTRITFGAGVSAVEGRACEGMKDLVSVTFGDDTKVVGAYAFSGCTSIGTIEWGDVEEIGEYAFAGCSSLSDLSLTCAQ